MSRSRSKKKNGKGIQFPITVREAQKLLSKSDWRKSSLPEYIYTAVLGRPPGHRHYISDFSDIYVAQLHKYLSKLASKDPNQVLIDANGKPLQSAENREEGESREKKTDEVAPTSSSPSEASEMHGGDGNSGECDAPAETFSTEEREGEQGSQEDNAQLQTTNADGGSQGQGSGDSQDSQGTENSDRNAPQSNCSETGDTTSENLESGGKSQAPTSQQAGSSESPNSESDEGTATSSVSDSEMKNSAANDNDPRDDQKSESPETAQPTTGDNETEGRTQKSADSPQNSLGENELDCVNDTNAEDKASDDVPTHQKKWGKSFSKDERGGGKLSLSNSSNNGGATASLKEAGVSPKLLKLCRQRLAALVGDSSQQHSPRREYTKFCVRLKTYRNPQPARKEEEGRPVILLLADVSGSCSSFSEESVKVAKAASKLGVPGADILVLAHYNGRPHEMEINGKIVDVSSIKAKAVKKTADNGYNWSNASGWYEGLMQRYNITVCIALGDWDGSLEYAYLAQHPQCTRFIWLDNAHCSSRGKVQDRTKFALDNYAKNFTGILIPVLRQKLIYRDGCKDAIAFINNIVF